MTSNRIHITTWMDQAASGDDAAFGHLADAVQDDLYRFALAHGLRRDDAADAVQETLLRAYRMRSRWRPGGEAMTWLWGICMNVVREARRQAAQRSGAGTGPGKPCVPGRGAGGWSSATWRSWRRRSSDCRPGSARPWSAGTCGG